MQRTGRPVSILIFISLLLVIGVGCTGESTAVPTLAVPAALPAVIEPAQIVALPGTYTPAPGEVAVDDNFAAAGGGALQREPTTTAFLPTHTPRPVTGPPTRTPLPTPTFTPGPPTAVPPYLPDDSAVSIYPYYPVVTGTRLGIHVIRNNDPNIMRFVREAQPAVIKAVGDVGFLEEVKEVSPRTITIGRFDQPDQFYAGIPEESARQYVHRYLDRYLLNEGVDYWEGWNEPDPGLENMSWYARFEAERVREMARYGLRTAIGGFATGTPEVDEFALFVPAVRVALEHGGILTLHEYSAPVMTYLYGGALPGYPAYPDRGALTFRYRWFYREILEPAGLVIPLAITEAGIDGIIGNRPGPNGYGWDDFSNYAIQQGWGTSAEDAFINQLAWYDRGTQEDPYVLGFTVFTAGAIGHWRNYNINPLLPELTDYVLSQR